ncbi:13184_t:CDS:2, partial [Cetraspora pellucida]
MKWNEEERIIEDEFAKADSMVANYVLQSEKHSNAIYKSQLINTRELIAKVGQENIYTIIRESEKNDSFPSS